MKTTYSISVAQFHYNDGGIEGHEIKTWDNYSEAFNWLKVNGKQYAKDTYISECERLRYCKVFHVGNDFVPKYPEHGGYRSAQDYCKF